MDERNHSQTQQILSVKTRFALFSLLCFALLLGISVYSGRILEPLGGAEIDLVGLSPSSLTSETRDFVERLDGRLAITFFISQQERMPSHLKAVERDVRALLTALRVAAPDRIHTRVLYPESSGAAGIAYAARKKVSPISVRRIQRDEHNEEKVWTALLLAYEKQAEVVIPAIEDAHLPHLEEWVLAHLRALISPKQPSFAFAASQQAEFEEFPQFLSQHGPVVQIDLDRSPFIPPDTDMLFWLEPQRVTNQHIRQLQRYLASGRTAILAGSTYTPSYHSKGDSVVYRMQTKSSAWTHLLRPFGLRPLPDLLMDRNAGTLPVHLQDGSVRDIEAPFHLRNLPAFRDFRRFRTPARGGISFVAASPLEVDPKRALQAGYKTQVVATTTEHAWIHELSADPLTSANLTPVLTVPKQNLMVLLSPHDPWAGSLVIMASASAFRKGMLRQPGYGHSVLLTDLVRTFASSDRLIRTAVNRHEPLELPPLSLETRLVWRAITIGVFPVILLGYGLWRQKHSANGSVLRTLRDLPWSKTIFASIAFFLALVTGALATYTHIDIDLTADSINTPTKRIVDILTEVRADLKAEYVVSPRAQLPNQLKSIIPRVVRPFATSGIELDVVHPEHLLESTVVKMEKNGMRPFEVEQVRRDTIVSQSVWSGLQLTYNGRVAFIPRLDDRTSLHVDFLTAAAVKRLQGHKRPVISVVSDLPRLSPAEALEDYQKKGLSAPTGTDVYSHLKRLLADYGYEVQHVNPRYPHLAINSDVVLWMQPRRDSGEIILQLSRYLASGGTAIVALQHFNIQQRQYRGTGFQTVYWPQPQFQDYDRYLRLFGIEQVRQVLMDRTRHHLQLDTQVNRSAIREYNAQEVALPFLIRTVNGSYNTHSPITSNLGDLLFIWGNTFDLSALPESIRANVLINTSTDAWSFAWKGGWLPPESLTPPNTLLGAQPLAVDLRGHFPEAHFIKDDDGRSQLAALRGGTHEGRLILVGSSEMFKNDYLQRTRFDHSQLLLNLMANAAYGNDMSLLQSRNRQNRGFAYHSSSGRTAWRIFAIFIGPLALCVVAGYRYRQRIARLKFSFGPSNDKEP